MSSRPLGLLLLVAALLFHALALLSPAWWQTVSVSNGRDFASYYYAVQVAADGGDPYDTKALSERARAEGTRKGVHPFLYAPPFVGMMAWAIPFDLPGAYHLWFWLHELCLLVAVLVLAGWWRALHPSVPWILAVWVALMTAVPNNHLMGQANFPGLALAMGGLWATERGRPGLGGALLGTACMLKMSPALLVAWWLLRRQWVAVAASVGTAVLLSVAVLPLVGLPHQVTFFRDVLPGFGSGDYNGLAVPIGIFGNHSLPNLWHQALPSGGPLLSAAARTGATASNLALLLGLGWWFRAAPRDELATAAQIGAVGIVMLLFPVYTYEHHLVWALPAMVVATVGVARDRLGVGWAVVVGLSVAALLFELAALKRTAAELHPVGHWLWMEAKTFGLFGLLAACARLGVSRGEVSGER
jgi:alpha-1,2-mannosyltransferase